MNINIELLVIETIYSGEISKFLDRWTKYIERQWDYVKENVVFNCGIFI
jgi:hypothetical protein